MKKRTAGHTETTISGDTRADWTEAFALVPSLEVAYVWHAPSSRARFSMVCCGSASFTTSRSSGTKAGRCSRGRTTGSSTSRAGSSERRMLRGSAKPARTRRSGIRRRRSSSWAERRRQVRSPHAEAGGADAAPDPESSPARRAGLRSVPRQRHDAGGRGVDRARLLRHRARSEVRRRSGSAVANPRGKKATLDGDGRTFEEIAAERQQEASMVVNDDKLSKR